MSKITPIGISLLTTVLTSRHAFALLRGHETHEPALRLSAQLARENARREFHRADHHDAAAGRVQRQHAARAPGMIRDAIKKGFGENHKETPSDNKASSKMSEIALHAIEASALSLFHTERRQPFISIPLARGRTRCFRVSSEVVANWVRHEFYRSRNKPLADIALKEVLATLAAKARFDGPCLPVNLRLAASMTRSCRPRRRHG